MSGNGASLSGLPDFAKMRASAEGVLEVLDLHASEGEGARATSAVWLRGELYARSRDVLSLLAALEAATAERRTDNQRAKRTEARARAAR